MTARQRLAVAYMLAILASTLLILALMLARVDGKSPAEYLDEPTRARVRQTALRLIAERPTTVEHSLAYCTA